MAGPGTYIGDDAIFTVVGDAGFDTYDPPCRLIQDEGSGGYIDFVATRPWTCLIASGNGCTGRITVNGVDQTTYLGGLPAVLNGPYPAGTVRIFGRNGGGNNSTCLRSVTVNNFGVVQHKKKYQFGSPGPESIRDTFAAAPTPGNLIVVGAGYQSGLTDMAGDAGLTAVTGTPFTCDYKGGLWWRKVQSGDGSTWGWSGTGGVGKTLFIAEISGSFGPILDEDTNCSGGTGPRHAVVSLSTLSGKAACMFGLSFSDRDSTFFDFTADSGYTIIDQFGSSTERPNSCLIFKTVASSSGTESPGTTFGDAQSFNNAIIAAAFGEQVRARTQALIV